MRRNVYAGSLATAVAEALESRRLLAGIEAGVLVARGTAGNDTISVRRAGTDDVIITTNGVNQTFDMDNLTGVRLEGLGGNDRFNMVDALVSPLVRNTTVLGGEGSDTIDYSSRTTDLHFIIDPSGNGAGMTSGPQADGIFDVETVIGGAGNDSFGYRAFDEPTGGVPVAYRFEGRGGNDSFRDAVQRGGAFEAVTMLGGDGNDSFANDSDDRFTNEFYFGEAGNDSVTVYKSNRGVIDGGSGSDTIHFSGSLEEQNADESAGVSDFPNFENATKSFGTLFGNDGANQLSLFGPGTVHGGGGNDTIVGNGNDQLLLGEGGNDSISGGEGSDTLDGGTGTDTLDGGGGNDTLLNGEVTPPPGQIRIINRILTADGAWGGEDISIVRTGIDDVIVRIDGLSRQFDMDDFDGVLLRGNNGYDRLTIDGAFGPIARKVTLDGGSGNDTLTGDSTDDVLRGGTGDDGLLGLGGNDALFGGAGNDHLEGTSGTDFHDGGDGNDTLWADDGFGGDTVLGGNGTDTARVDPGDNASGVEAVD